MTQCPWSHWTPATIQFCEKELCSWITQPSNTISNIAFIICGILIIYDLRSSKQRELYTIGWSSIFLGFGSGMFHLSSTFFFEIFDLLGMYLISSFMLSLNLRRLLHFSLRKTWLIYITNVLICASIQINFGKLGIPLFVAQLFAAIEIERRLRRKNETINYRSLMKSGLFFLISFLIWAGDISGILCNPNNHVLTGHAVWHILNAFAIYYIYKFYTQFKEAPKN